jgi:hypothetical protein
VLLRDLCLLEKDRHVDNECYSPWHSPEDAGRAPKMAESTLHVESSGKHHGKSDT